MWEAEWPWWGRLLSAEPSGNYCPVWTLQAADQIKRLYDLFLKVDATQVEVNPLGETPEGQGTLYHREMTVFLSVCVCVCVLTWPLSVCALFVSVHVSACVSLTVPKSC